MPIADHGGFGLAIELAEDTITSAASGMNVPTGAPVPFTTTAGLRGVIRPQSAISDTALVIPDVFRLRLDTQGTIAGITQFTLNDIPQNVPAWMQDVPIGGIITVDDALEVRGNALIVDYTNDPAHGFPLMSPQIDEPAILAAPLIQFILAEAILADPANGNAYRDTRTQLLTDIRNEVENGVQAQVNNIGILTLAPSPAIPGVVITSIDFRMRDRAIHLLYSICGIAGNRTAITRSSLLRRTSDQLPLDVAALIISNIGLLSCFVRPAVTARLGLTAGGFIAGHPCLWIGSVPFTPPGGNPPLIASVSVTSVLAGMDGTNLRLLINIVATGVASAFTVTASIDTTFSLAATITGRTLTLAMTQLGAPVVTSDVSIALWVYVGGIILAGGVGVGAAGLLAQVLVAVDVLGGLLLNGGIAGAVVIPTPPIGIPLPSGLPAVAVRAQSLRQTDAPTRMVTLPGGISFADPFPANDWIINLA